MHVLGFYPNYENYLSQGDTEFLPKASISYFADNGTHYYASYAKGFEPGNYNLYTQEGVPSLVPFGKETADNFEFGVKGATELGTGALNFSAAVFYIDYTDRQFELQNQISVGGIIENILNAGELQPVRRRVRLLLGRQRLPHPERRRRPGGRRLRGRQSRCST